MTYNTLTPKTMQLWKDNNIHKGYAYSEDLNLYYFANLFFCMPIKVVCKNLNHWGLKRLATGGMKVMTKCPTVRQGLRRC